MNINYSAINSRAINILMSAKKHTSSIDNHLKTLLELRVSQVNGCSYCIDLHSNEAQKMGERQQRLDCLPTWRESDLFSKKEIAALSWAESVTNISTVTNIEDKLKQLLVHYN